MAGALLVVSFAVMVAGAAVFTNAVEWAACASASDTEQWAACWRPWPPRCQNR